jgi:hypothetical protein
MNVRPTFILLLIVVVIVCSWSALRFRMKSTRSSPAFPAVSEQPRLASTNRPSPQPTASSEYSNISHVAEILERRDQQIAEIKRRASEFETETDRQEIAELTRQSAEEINALLSVAEQRTLQVEQLKQTDLGKALMEHFGASAEELASISDYEKNLAEVLATPGGDLEGVQSRSLAKLKRIIGEDRTNEFMNYHDPDYVEALAFMKRFNLPSQTVTDLMKIRYDDGKARLERIQQGLSGSDAIITDSSRSRVKELLGTELADVYIRDSKGASWLR